MRKIILHKLFLTIFIIFSNNVYAACVQLNNQIGLVGLDSVNGNVYAALSEHNNACGCNHVRFLPTNTDTKMALSILLSAKMSGKSVRIDISDPANCDTGYRAYIQ